jgi:hypothetical protein
MLKSGLITAGVMLVLAIGVSLLSPICVPCLAIFVGLGAGYLAGLFDKPASNGAVAKAGAAAGAIGGVGAIVGHLIGGVINVFIVGPEKAMELMRQWGFPSDMLDSSNPTAYYAGAFGGACCVGLVDLLLLAGLGALGGLLWWQITGKKAAAPPAMMPPSM